MTFKALLLIATLTVVPTVLGAAHQIVAVAHQLTSLGIR